LASGHPGPLNWQVGFTERGKKLKRKGVGLGARGRGGHWPTHVGVDKVLKPTVLIARAKGKLKS